MSAGCLFWLDKLTPLFFALSIGSVVYQGLILKRRPPFLRTRGAKTIFAVSVILNVLVIVAWVVLYYRYNSSGPEIDLTL